MKYSITVTLGDHSPQVDVIGNPPCGEYEITGRDDEVVAGTFPPRQPDDGRPKVTYSPSEDTEV